MAKTQKAEQNVSMDVIEVERGTIEVCILGTSPIILNRMSQKALHELLLPKGRKSQSERATTLKHDPMQEFRDSPYVLPASDAPTYLAVRGASFKKAMMTAALDLPGAQKSQVGRNAYVPDDYVPLYGLPKLFMSVVRSADIRRTPDVRTRAIVPSWACKLSVTFVKPLLRDQAVANLIAASGLTCGIGDWRPEKGAGSFGQFEVVDRNDPRFVALVEGEGRAAQLAAMDTPEPYDDETSTLLSWYHDEIAKRTSEGRVEARRPKARRRTNGSGAEVETHEEVTA